MLLYVLLMICATFCLIVCGCVGAPCSVLLSPPVGNLAHLCPVPYQMPTGGGEGLLRARMGQPTQLIITLWPVNLSCSWLLVSH